MAKKANRKAKPNKKPRLASTGGVVELRDLTLHTGFDRATAFGEQNLAKKISPKFLLRLVNVKVVGNVINGQRPKWGVFTYQADLVLQNVTFIGKEQVEQALGLDTTYEASYIEGGVWPFSRDRSFGP